MRAAKNRITNDGDDDNDDDERNSKYNLCHTRIRGVGNKLNKVREVNAILVINNSISLTPRHAGIIIVIYLTRPPKGTSPASCVAGCGGVLFVCMCVCVLPRCFPDAFVRFFLLIVYIP